MCIELVLMSTKYLLSNKNTSKTGIYCILCLPMSLSKNKIKFENNVIQRIRVTYVIKYEFLN